MDFLQRASAILNTVPRLMVAALWTRRPKEGLGALFDLCGMKRMALKACAKVRGGGDPFLEV